MLGNNKVKSYLGPSMIGVLHLNLNDSLQRGYKVLICGNKVLISQDIFLNYGELKLKNRSDSKNVSLNFEKLFFKIQDEKVLERDIYCLFIPKYSQIF